MRRLFFLLLFFASAAYGQGVRYSSTVTQQGTIGTATNAVVLPAGATIAFCNHPANAVPCTNKATTYTDQTLTSSCNTSTQLVLDGTSTCVALPDAQNNWGVWVAPNAAGYDYTIALPGGVNRGPFNVLAQTTTHTQAETFSNSPVQTIANSPAGATESGNTVTITMVTVAACGFVTGQAITISGVGVSGYNGGWTVLSPGCNGGSSFTYRNPVQSLANSGGGTVAGGSPVFSGRSSFIGGIGSNTFGGPMPWIDVTDPVYGAKCDGSTDDTAAFNAALNVANTQLSQSGAAIRINLTPANPGPCVIATQLNMDNMSNIAIVGNDMTTAAAGGNASQAMLKFNGTCTAAACLSLRSTSDITFWGVRMSFPNATSAGCTNTYFTVTLCPMIDLSHAGANGDSARIKFHGGALIGPGVTLGGPIVLDQNTDEVVFDQHILMTGATVFISGPVNNSAGFSDKTVIRDAQLFLVGTSAIQNASVDWTIQDCVFTLRNGAAGTNGVPALQYVNSYTNQQNLMMIGNEFLAQISPTNTFTLVSVPAAGTNLGGLKFESELVAIADANMTALNIGNSNAATVTTNVFSSTGIVLNVGTGVQLAVGPNIYQSITTFLTGTPQNGVVTNNAAGATTTIYSGTNSALQAINGNVYIGGSLGSQLNSGTLFYSTTAPTIAAAGCGGGAASVSAQNGSFAFKINVGTTPGSACTFTMPAATTGWNVSCTDITTNSTSVFLQKQTGAESTTSVTITNFNDVAAATAFVASDILKCTAAAD